MSFWKCLKFGNIYEKKLVEQLKLENVELAPKKLFSDWDIKTDKETYEVKADRFTYKTGNFCIEYESNKKPSGLSVTKATIYAYYVVKPSGEDLYIIPVLELKELIKENKFNTRYLGNNNLSKCHLIPEKYFEKYLV